jgi:hypothetical protein
LAEPSKKLTPAALRWHYEQDAVGYFLVCATLRAKPKQKQRIIDAMTDENKRIGRMVLSGSWTRG